MNSKSAVSLFLISFLLMGPGCYAEDVSMPTPPSSGAPVADSALTVTPVAPKVTGKWSDDWYQGAEGYDKAVAEYQQTNKPMLVYMTVGWCPYCRQFEKGVLSSPKVREFLKDKIKVSIDPESGARENELASQYGIRGFPSLFLHPPQPETPLNFPTRVTPEEFIELFQQSVQ